jgi:hypothetical protein
MDKIKKYQDIIVDFLNYYNREMGNTTIQNIKRRVLIDRENNSFQLLAIGWGRNSYIFSPMFHFDIINEKIWIQCNNTEWEIVDFLMEAGVPKTDIVLGFVPADARHFYGFSVG